MRIRLALRRERVRLEPFTGIAYCGCRLLNGDVFESCGKHRGGPGWRN